MPCFFSVKLFFDFVFSSVTLPGVRYRYYLCIAQADDKNMDSDLMINFNKTLLSITEIKPPISKQKIVDVTKAALDAVRYFKHVVFSIEKFLVKCRNEYKLSGLYVMDSILRQAKKKYKQKDVIAARFAVNLQNTFTNILTCDPSDRLKAVRVLNLWLANGIFTEDVIEPILQYCRASGIEVDVRKVEFSVKGDKANLTLYGIDSTEMESFSQKLPKTPPQSAAPRTPPMPRSPATNDETNGDQLQENRLNERDVLSLLEDHPDIQHLVASATNNKALLTGIQNILNERVTEKVEIDKRRSGNIKNLLSREFDYSDEEEDDEDRKGNNEGGSQSLSKEYILSVARTILSDGSVTHDLQQLTTTSSKQIPPHILNAPQQILGAQPFPFPPPNFSVPPPTGASFFPPIGVPPPIVNPGGNIPPQMPSYPVRYI
ncbi:RNA polymerase II-binding domain-containing protein [Ditylenchus destructor]|nr:RNA polymerase II-binding domain-containing protein [Ditylenchus destructor]